VPSGRCTGEAVNIQDKMVNTSEAVTKIAVQIPKEMWTRDTTFLDKSSLDKVTRKKINHIKPTISGQIDKIADDKT
jgi:hypothetical protein